jgi:hypothetical protein
VRCDDIPSRAMQPIQITMLAMTERNSAITALAHAKLESTTIHVRAHFMKPRIDESEMWDYAKCKVMHCVGIALRHRCMQSGPLSVES